jgi:hypothetical protein
MILLSSRQGLQRLRKINNRKVSRLSQRQRNRRRRHLLKGPRVQLQQNLQTPRGSPHHNPPEWLLRQPNSVALVPSSFEREL